MERTLRCICIVLEMSGVIEAVPFLLALSAAGLLAVAHQTVKKTMIALQRTAIVQAETMRYIRGREQLSDFQEAVEVSVEGVTASVRTVHRGIAAIPFGILEAIPVTRDTTKVVRAIHDATSDVVYGSISFGNRLAGRGLRKGLEVKKTDSAADTKNAEK